VFVLLLPFRLLGGLIAAVGSVAFGVGKVLLLLLLAPVVLLALAAGALVVPLLPVLLLVALAVLLVRALRPRPVGVPVHPAPRA
jgi:hypothetical protein